MAEYIEREAFIAWLKRIPLKDLSDGLGLCRIIMEEDFKRAIRELPREVIADVAPVVHGRWEKQIAVRCRECKHCDPENYHCDHPMGTAAPLRRKPDDFCSYGEPKEGADNG